MIKNLRYAFTFDRPGMRKAIFWEWLHGSLLAIPSGIILIVIWELFKPQPDTQRMFMAIAIMGGLFFIQLFVAKQAMIFSNSTTFEMSRKLRLALGNKLQRLSLGYYKKRDPGDLASVVLQDVANFENIFGHSISNIFNAIFGTFVLSLFLLYLDWRLAITLILGIVITVPIIQWARWLISKLGAKQIQARNETSARFLEYVLGIQHIKSYGMTGSQFHSLDQALSDLRRESIRVEAIPGPLILLAGIVLEVTFIIMVGLSLYFLTGTSVTIPVILAFLIIGYRLYEPVKILMIEYPVLSYMNVSLGRIIDVLEAKEQQTGQALIPHRYDIEFDQVTFAYVDDQSVLDSVSFHSPMGTMTALVGPSGSGKTTITSLIARFWDIDEGSIRIGGIDLREMRPSDVYSLISEVFQEVYLFDDTIYQNILVGNPEATQEQVEQAAQLAQVMEFVEKLPQGLETKVGEGGSKLSGGQKQRISIARALLKDAPIVLLDEATASLDPENEIYIQRAIQALVKDKTVIVIAHKLATIQQADMILVLDEGKMVERGKHEPLLEKEGLYAKLWNTQQQARGWKMTAHHEPTRDKHESEMNMTHQSNR